MDGANEPAEVHFIHDVLHGGVRFSDGWLVVECHGKSSRELDKKARQSDSTQAVEDIDVGGDVLAGDVVSKRLNLQALLKPVVNISHTSSGS